MMRDPFELIDIELENEIEAINEDYEHGAIDLKERNARIRRAERDARHELRELQRERDDDYDAGRW